MHHAYLVVGDPTSAEEYLLSFLSEQGIQIVGSPDYFVWKEPLFGIDEARKLAEMAARKAFGERKILFVTPEKITLEAQNALLKTFEDPVEDTHFFLVVREEELVIPTLRSRMQAVHLGQSSALTNEAQKFLTLKPADRLEFVKKFVDKEKNLSAFLDELMTVLRKNGSIGIEPLKKVYEVRRFSDDRAASARLILEHLALIL